MNLRDLLTRLFRPKRRSLCVWCGRQYVVSNDVCSLNCHRELHTFHRNERMRAEGR